MLKESTPTTIQIWRWHAGTTPATPRRAIAANPESNVATASIAVLPFTNMSGDPEQEYFSDGISEDIITDLSKIAGLTVIARNSSFTYKGRAVDVRTKIFRLPARGQLGDCFNLRRARYRLLTSLDAMPAVFPSAQCPASTRRISANRA